MIPRLTRQVILGTSSSGSRWRAPGVLAMIAIAACFAGGCGGSKGGEANDLGQPLKAYVAPVEGVPHTCIALITNGEKLAGFVTDSQHASSWLATSQLEDG